MHSENHGSSDASGREPLAGLVERVTFHNPDNGFCVLRVKVKGHHELVTLLGAAPSSEHPAVVIPLTTQHYLILRRNLVYTAITRAKQLVVLVGQRRA